MIIRSMYLDKLEPFIDVKLVKILVGIRRCGKSTILMMIKQKLLSRGVKEDHIIVKNYSFENFNSTLTHREMYDELKSYIVDNDKYYFLLDELQEIKDWERVIMTMLEQYNTDIYITGSNSKLTPSGISTYLTGRYILIPVYTLSFKEYLLFRNDSNKSNKEKLNDYLRYGGFPLPASLNFNEQMIYACVQDIYKAILTSDILGKYGITNRDLFNRLVRFIVENVGNTFSANSIKNFLKSENRIISVETIYNYIEYLENAFIIYKCKRYDIHGKNILKTQEKFYLADQSIGHALYGFNVQDISPMLENIVFLELKRRGYDVYVGKNANREIDFVAINRDKKLYIQVCKQLPTKSDREVENLEKIKDHFPKIIVTYDDYACGNINGIRIVNIVDFLLNEDY